MVKTNNVNIAYRRDWNFKSHLLFPIWRQFRTRLFKQMRSSYGKCITLYFFLHNTLQWRHMNIVASQITLNSIAVCSTVCSGLHQRIHQRSVDLILCERNPQLTRKFPLQRANNEEMFPCHDVIMSPADIWYSNDIYLFYPKAAWVTF